MAAGASPKGNCDRASEVCTGCSDLQQILKLLEPTQLSKLVHQAEHKAILLHLLGLGELTLAPGIISVLPEELVGPLTQAKALVHHGEDLVAA